MIRYIEGKLYMALPQDGTDSIVVELLKEGRSLVEDSINDTIERVAESGLRPHHLTDLEDNAQTLQAFNRLLAYYGG
jgi:hypothetical protein